MIFETEMIFSGTPGSNKETLLRKLTFECSSEERRISITKCVIKYAHPAIDNQSCNYLIITIKFVNWHLSKPRVILRYISTSIPNIQRVDLLMIFGGISSCFCPGYALRRSVKFSKIFTGFFYLRRLFAV